MSDENPKITTELELDKGSVKKTVDDAEKAGEKAGKGFAERMSDAFKNIKGTDLAIGVAGLNQGLELAKKGLDKLGEAFKATVEAIHIAEDIKAINVQFDTLAMRAGVNGLEIKAGLEKASEGFVDQEDLLKASNRAMIELGANAQRFPEILEIARKSSALTGRDVIETFEGITQAISSGNSRALKTSQIFLDQEKVFDAYADSIGKATRELTLADRQQALLNATLTEGAAALANIDPNLRKAGNAFTALNVAAGDAKEGISTAFAAIFSPFYTAVARTMTVALDQLGTSLQATFGEGSAKSAAQVKILEKEITRLNHAIDQAQKAGTHQSYIDGFTRSLERAKKELQTFRDIQQAQIDDQRKAARGQAMTDADKAAAAYGILDPDEVAKRNAAFQASLMQANQANLQMKIANAQAIADEELREQALGKLVKDQTEIENQNHLAKMAALNNQYLIDKDLTKKQFEALEAAETERHGLVIEQIEKASALRRQKQQEEIAKNLRATMVGGLSSTLQSVGVALQKGEDLFDAFGKGIVGIVGDMAIQLGTALIAQGIALEGFITAVNFLTPGSGLAAAATGAALVIFGAALKASVGKGGSSGGGSFDSGGGGITSSPGEGTSFTEPTEKTATGPGTNINVTVQGNIMNSKETYFDIAEGIRETFESQGIVTVTGNA